MSRFFDPPKATPLLPKEQIDKKYKSMRLKVFLGSFVGYAAYYLVRKNLSLAAPAMIEQGLVDKAGVGIAMSAVSIAYAFSKFIMGTVSDRSDARKFLVVGLILSAITMMAVGFMPFAVGNIALNVAIIFALMLIVGWLSGMGWPPCGRIMAHWFSQNERSFKMSLWNTSHTLGGGTLGLLVTAGVALFVIMGIPAAEGWRAAFIFPSAVALLLALFCWWALRDTPQSCGLPPIEEYRNDYSGVKTKGNVEEKLPFKELLRLIVTNKWIWLIALTNAFVYMVRYGIGDWAPTYLQEKEIMTASQSNLAFTLHNYAGIVGTIFCGWISSKFFKGKCALPNIIFMGGVLVGVLMYAYALPMSGGNMAAARTLSYIGLILVGFFIYGPVALVSVQALNLVPKNAAGTAAGFVGLFGYLLGDAVLSKWLVGPIAQMQDGWNTVFILFAAASVLAILFCAMTIKSENPAPVKK